MGLECKTKGVTVHVLMSSFNGEKYIEEQIDSILCQTYSNIKIFIRDDGSTDRTISILEKYENKGKIVLFRGNNVGYIASFFEVLKLCDKAEYYAWCDQDDVWRKDKISRAVEVLGQERKKTKENLPILYFSDYDYYDEDMNFQGHGLIHEKGPSFANSLMDCISLGFNSVFNDCARMKMVQNLPKYSCGHDWWTYMLCAALGKVLYDKGYSTVKYRRLPKSVSPGGKKFLSLQIWRFKKFFLNHYFKKVRKQIREFAFLYEKELKVRDRKIIKPFLKSKYSIIQSLRKVCYRGWYRQGIVEECMVRILCMIGKL